MKVSSGREMRRLMVAVSLSVLCLLLAVIAYYMIDVAVTTDRNMRDNREKVIAESVRTIQDMKSALIMTDFSPQYLEVFNQDLLKQIVGGDIDALYRYATQIVLTFYPIDYVAFIAEGKVLKSGARKGLEINPYQIPLEPPEGDYQILDKLGNREGFFVSVFFPVDLSKLGLGNEKIPVNMVVDRTEEIYQVEKYFRDQRNSLLLRLSIAAILAVVASLLLTTFGLRYFTRKYVVDPIERLNRQAQEIMEGTFQGEVEVDEKSAFAPLQGLLRSGQKVLQRMEKELEG